MNDIAKGLQTIWEGLKKSAIAWRFRIEGMILLFVLHAAQFLDPILDTAIKLLGGAK